MIFSKFVLRPLGMLKQMFLGHFEPLVARFGHEKSQNALKTGRFGTNNVSKMGERTCFSKNDAGPFMMLKQVVFAHSEPVATGFGPSKIPKCLENRPFVDQKWVKNG